MQLGIGEVLGWWYNVIQGPVVFSVLYVHHAFLVEQVEELLDAFTFTFR